MRVCHLCRFELELDDVSLQHERGGCICLRCYARETGTTRPLPKALRRVLVGVVEAAEQELDARAKEAAAWM